MKFNILDCHKKCWNLLEDEKSQFDQEIYENFIDKVLSLNIDKYFLVYWSQENEPDTKKIIKYLLDNKHKVCLLHVNAKKNISCFAIESLDFKYDYFWNMKMPKPKLHKQVFLGEIGCVVIPAIAYNNKNEIAIYPSNHLFLSYFEHNPHVIVISLAYKFSVYNDINFGKKIRVNLIIHNN